jgi:hypothetical protein
MHRPVQQLRHRHYEILRCVFEGQTYAAIARAFGCCRETVWNLVRSPPGQQVLAEWHAQADRLMAEQPLRTSLLARWLTRGQVRLAEGSAQRRRQLEAIARARLAKQRHREAQQGSASPKLSESPGAVPPAYAEGQDEAPTGNPSQAQRALRTIDVLQTREDSSSS